MAPLAAPTDAAVTASGLVVMRDDGSNAAHPVRGPDGPIVAIVPTASLLTIAPKRRDHIRAGDLTVPWNEFVSARTDESLSVVLTSFQTSGCMHALVYDEWGAQVGYVGMDELSRTRNE